MTPAIPVQNRVPFLLKIAYSLPGLPLHVLSFAALAILPTFYATHTQTSMTQIGTILLATRIFDAVVHPLIGFASDRALSWGSGRKAWVFAGSILCAAATYFLLTPSPDSGPIYFTIWSILLYAAWTILEVPHRAWGAELSGDYRERSRIFAVLGQVRVLGAVIFLAVPLLPIFGSSDITRPEIMRTIAFALVLAFPIAALIALVLVPEGRSAVREKSTLGGLFRSVARNKPFWLFLLVFAFTGVGIGIYNSVLLLFVSAHLHLADYYPILAILYFAVAFAMLPLWTLLMNRLGKHVAWSIGMAVFAAALPTYWFAPTDGGALPFAIVLTLIIGAASSVHFVAPLTVLSDIIDYDIMKTGVNRAGNYFALLQLVQTAEIAIGGGIGFLLLGHFGFDPRAENTTYAVFGLKLTFLVLPAALYLIAALLILRSPIDAKRHDIIRRRIEARTKRLAAQVSV